jgi:hypothetical protein
MSDQSERSTSGGMSQAMGVSEGRSAATGVGRAEADGGGRVVATPSTSG